MYNKPITTLLKEANEIEDMDLRAQFLQKYMRQSVKEILAAFHNDSLVFDKFKDVKYRNNHNKPGISDSTLDHESKRLYLLLKDSGLTQEKKRNKLIQMLESMCKEESDLLLEYVIQKKNPFKKLDKRFVKKYFPEVINMTLGRT